MTDLLDQAAAAHGGWELWRTTRRLDVRASFGGGLWAAKGQAGKPDDVRIAIDTQRQHVRHRPFGGVDLHSVYEPGMVVIAPEGGYERHRRSDPQAAFGGHTFATPWDEFHLAYFSGYAIWNHLTVPLLFRLPGIRTEEVASWEEDEERWRRLRVLFPQIVTKPSNEQVFYFDATGLLRRQDYGANIAHGRPAAHYCAKPKTFGGLVFPTERRAFERGPDNRTVPADLIVTIDIFDIDVVGNGFTP